MSNCYSFRLIAGVFFCLLASSAWAIGIKHPSDYGDVTSSITLTPCGGSSPVFNGVSADCFLGSGPSSNDFLFTFFVSPAAEVTSVTFNLTDIPVAIAIPPTDPVGLLEGTPADCAAMNVVCTPAEVGFTASSPLTIGDNTFLFTNFSGALSGQVTAYFQYDDIATAPTFTAATISGTTATPEPSQIGLLALALGSVIALRRKQKVNG
jgi:hypothetical protein